MIEQDVFVNDKSELYPGDAAAAILRADDGQVLLQLRDSIEGIFYPGYWGCFGGAIEEDDEGAIFGLQRELREELGVFIDLKAFEYFTTFTFDMSFCGIDTLTRTYFDVSLKSIDADDIVLGEGSAFRFFNAEAALSESNVVPYDAYALWLYFSKSRISATQLRG
ncbi:MAG: NUDIX domain-containing protein [Rhodospirillaceae bacterium]